MNRTRTTRLLAVTTVAGLVMGTTLLTAGPAFAAPGDASATGIGIDIDAGLLSTLLGAAVDAGAGASAVVGSGTDSDELLGADASIVGSVLANATADAIETEAASSTTGSGASSSIAGVDVGLLGLPGAITADTVSASAICPVGVGASTTTEFTGLEVLGTAVTVDDLGTAVEVDLAGALLGLTLSVTVDEVETVTTSAASAVALEALVEVSGSLLAFPLVDISGVVTLATAECERPTVALVATALSPTTGPTAGGQTVTITGAGFLPGTTVTFDGVPATDVVIAPTGASLTAVTPLGDVGSASVVVTSGGVPGTPLAYTYVAPTVASLTPAQGSESGGDTVTIVGTGLGDTDEVDFGGTPATIVSVTPTQVVVTSPAGTGSVDVTVSSSTGIETDAGEFQYLASTILGYTPTGGSEDGGTLVIITGTGLDDTDTVTFGGADAIVLSSSATEVVVVTPPGTGLVPVAIEFTDGRTVTASALFQYIGDDDRVVADIDPRQGPVAGGQTVTITGTGLTDIDSVEIGGAAAPIVSVSADGTQVVVTTPAGPAGFAAVELEFGDGDIVDAGDYLYVGPGSAVVDTITPSSGPTAGGTTVVIVGDNLDGVTEVTFGGAPGTIVGTPTDTSITVVTPAGSAGAVDVVLTSADGPALVEGGFTYAAPAAPAAAGPGAGLFGGLASTGLDTPVLPLTIGALLALLAGGALMLMRLRRRGA